MCDFSRIATVMHGGLKKLRKPLKFKVMAHELDMPAIQPATGSDVEHVVKGGGVSASAAVFTSFTRQGTRGRTGGICRGSRR